MDQITFKYPEEDILDHPSDVGLKSQGKTLEEALEMLISSFYGLQLKRVSELSRRRINLKICARDEEGIAVKIISELLYLLKGEHMIWNGRLKVNRSPEGICVIGRGIGRKVAWRPEDVQNDIKGVTYHNIKTGVESGIYVIRMFFDI